MRIYCRHCSYRFEPKNQGFNYDDKPCPNCGANKTLVKDFSAEDILKEIDNEDLIIRRQPEKNGPIRNTVDE